MEKKEQHRATTRQCILWYLLQLVIGHLRHHVPTFWSLLPRCLCQRPINIVVVPSPSPNKCNNTFTGQWATVRVGSTAQGLYSVFAGCYLLLADGGLKVDLAVLSQASSTLAVSWLVGPLHHSLAVYIRAKWHLVHASSTHLASSYWIEFASCLAGCWAIRAIADIARRDLGGGLGPLALGTRCNFGP